MDNIISPNESNNDFTLFIAGQENLPSISIKERRLIILLAMFSFTVALSNALSSGMLIELYADTVWLSITGFVLIIVLLLLFNRMVFITTKSYKGRVLLLTAYFLLYAFLSYITINVISFYALQPEISDLIKNNAHSALDAFAAYGRVVEKLDLYKSKAFTKIQCILFFISYIFSLLPLLLSNMISGNVKNKSEYEKEKMRNLLIEKINAKKKEYIEFCQNTYHTTGGDPFAPDNGISQEERQNKIELLIHEIDNLEIALKDLFP